MNTLRVCVAWSAPGTAREIAIELPEPASVQMAIDAATVIAPETASVAAAASAVGVWGKVRSPDHMLREGDRVELYAALKADPKEARRAKARQSVHDAGKK